MNKMICGLLLLPVLAFAERPSDDDVKNRLFVMEQVLINQQYNNIDSMDRAYFSGYCHALRFCLYGEKLMDDPE